MNWGSWENAARLAVGIGVLYWLIHPIVQELRGINAKLSLLVEKRVELDSIADSLRGVRRSTGILADAELSEQRSEAALWEIQQAFGKSPSPAKTFVSPEQPSLIVRP